MTGTGYSLQILKMDFSQKPVKSYISESYNHKEINSANFGH
jgi:hypothetical protein